MLGMGGWWSVVTELIAENAWNLVELSCLSIPTHGHTLVRHNQIDTTVEQVNCSTHTTNHTTQTAIKLNQCARRKKIVDIGGLVSYVLCPD